MPPLPLLILYCVLIALGSLLGGWLPSRIRLTHTRLEIALSFVSGVMLGVALLHLLPHALIELSAGEHDGHSHEGVMELSERGLASVSLWLVAGLLVMFLIERFFSFHSHDAPASDSVDHVHDHDDHHHRPSHRLAWTGAMIGLSLHTLINGIALAASVQSEYVHLHAPIAGLGTFLVIFLHKPFDALTIAALMTRGRSSGRTQWLVNVMFSLMVAVGVVLFHLGVRGEGETSHAVVGAALAFSAGTFLCIALSDLLPELHFHQHDRGKLSIALLLGVALAWVLSVFEPGTH